MRSTVMTLAGSLGLAVAVLQTSCTELWGTFSEQNPNYCDESRLCPAGQSCDPATHTCIDLTSADGGTLGDGSAASDLALPDNTIFYPAAILNLTGTGTGLIAGAASDFDKDGNKDLVILGHAGATNRVVILYGDGRGGFQQAAFTNTADADANSITVGDPIAARSVENLG